MARPQAPRIPISRWRGRAWEHVDDAVAAEEPLQLLLNGEPLSIVMRTPGHDIEAAMLPPLALQLRGGQRVFDATGGLHAAGLFTAGGELVTLREDIGRHNA